MIDETKTVAQLQLEEGFRSVPYLDTKKNLTFGIGYNVAARGFADFERIIGRVLGPSPTCTLEEAQAVCLADVRRIQSAVMVYFPEYTALIEVRQRAIVDLAFNMDMGLLSFKKAIAAARVFDWSTCARELYKSDWRVEVGPTRSNRVIQMILTGKDYTA